MHPPPNPDPARVPWPDLPVIPVALTRPTPEGRSVEPLAFCCPECGNNELVEVPITTDQGREWALECDSCGEAYPT